MAWELIVSFFLAAVLLGLMPGVDNCFVLTESLACGWRRGLSIVCGLCSGCVVHTLLCATGVSLVVMGSRYGFMLIQYLGCLYFLYLAWSSFRMRAENPIENKGAGQGGGFYKGWRKGFFMNLLNPKVAIFFIAFFPQFLRGNSPPVFVQMTAFGLLFIVATFFVFAAIAFAAGAFARFFESPAVWRGIKYVQAVLFLLLAGSLLLLDSEVAQANAPAEQNTPPVVDSLS